MKKFISCLIFLFSLAFTAPLFAEINVLSPVEGTWSNKQMLVIDDSENNEYLYSLNGSDPEAFGFAYDGPVLIDMTGDIELRIKKLGSSDSVLINFSVDPDSAVYENYHDFISSFYDNGIVSYVSGTELEIPSELEYSLGSAPFAFLQGQIISISEKSVLSRYIPCTVQEKESSKKWRFVIRTLPQTAGVFSRRDVPFFVTDWNTITFTDENLIYKIDSEYWELPKKERVLDRTQTHMISWQSLSYEQGNPIEYFVLPPKPKINEFVDESGCILYTIDGDESYSFSILSDDGYGSGYQELFKEIGADTFFGDSISGKLTIGVFSNSVYQGQIETSYNINKRPPSTPEIIASEKNFYSRSAVNLSLKSQGDSTLYYAVSDPYFIQSLANTYTPQSEIFDSVQADFFIKADSGRKDVLLEPQNEGAVYYKVRCYSENPIASSSIVEYSVIIDQYNYYFLQGADEAVADGTAQNPFGSFKQCMDAVNSGRNSCLYINGTVTVPRGQTSLLSNCVFRNSGNAVIEFMEDSSLVIKSASLEIEDCTIKMQSQAVASQRKIIPLFKLEKSVLTMSEVQVSVNGGKNTTLIESYSSSVNVFNSMLSVNSLSYSTCVSSVGSNLNLNGSSIYTSADTSVILSAKEGLMNIKNCTFKVTAKQGRIAEFFAARGRLENNLLKSDLSGSSGVKLIYQDEKSTVSEKNNDLYGY